MDKSSKFVAQQLPISMDLQTAAKYSKWLDLIPRRHRLHAKEGQLSCNPFFIVGSGRNGSTMFSGMLNSHSKILLPTEQWRLPNMILKYKFYHFLPWKELVSLIIGEIAASNSALNWNINFNDALALLQYLPKEERSLQRIIDEIYVAYGTQHEESFACWGEKSPKNMPYTREIYRAFPKSRYIFLLRDGRDVARSWLIKNESEDIKWIAESWNESIEMYEWLQKRLGPEQLYLVQYEDLVTETEATLRGVVKFLGCEFEASMLAFQGYAAKIEGDPVFNHFKQLRKAANPSSIGKWKDYFSPEKTAYLEGIIRKNMVKFNYAPTT